ncbi:MAG: MaoC family dehydratase [Alphaproteobacteria bacterium]|nr:MaoC family dehydratase [Alphaproteobacteria bacterium]
MGETAAEAALVPKGTPVDTFQVGQVFEHHWGRTIAAAESSLFSSLTLAFNPLYFNVEYARAHGHPDLVVNPYLVFNTVFGLSVEDLSESGPGGGGAFLGVDGLRFLAPVYPGDTLYARSEVLAKRESESRPGSFVLTWRTEGVNQRGATVIAFERSNLRRRA